MKLPITKSPVQLRFSDLDILGHVSNGIYNQYLELGRITWFKKIGGEFPDNVVAKITTEFLKEVNLTDDVYVTTSCVKKGVKSLTLSQNIYANEVLVTRAEVVLVGFDLKTRQSCKILEGWEIS